MEELVSEAAEQMALFMFHRLNQEIKIHSKLPLVKSETDRQVLGCSFIF